MKLNKKSISKKIIQRIIQVKLLSCVELFTALWNNLK